MTACKIFEPASPLNGLSLLIGDKDNITVLKSLVSTFLLDSRFEEVRFVIRQTSPNEAGLYAFGDIPPLLTEQLIQLSRQLHRADRAARFVDYKEAEQLSGTLGEKLISRFGSEELKTFNYLPVPRGGYIVQGMLSYQLGLSGAKMDDKSHDLSRPVVLVDDCIISGLRAREYADKLKNRNLIFSTLFAPEKLCRKDSSVDLHFDILSAVELEDLAPELYGDSYGLWKNNWKAICGDSVLWTGQTEYLAFSWNEPESTFFNAHSKKIEPGFKLVSPDRCLNNAQILTGKNKLIDIHKDGPGPINAPPHIITHQLDGESVALANFFNSSSEDSTSCFLLEGSSAYMWNALIKHGEMNKAAKELASIYDIGFSDIIDDLSSFMDSLIELGLIVYDK